MTHVYPSSQFKAYTRIFFKSMYLISQKRIPQKIETYKKQKQKERKEKDRTERVKIFRRGYIYLSDSLGCVKV